MDVCFLFLIPPFFGARGFGPFIKNKEQKQTLIFLFIVIILLLINVLGKRLRLLGGVFHVKKVRE